MKLNPAENEYKCHACGKYFQRSDTRQKYCSGECRRRRLDVKMPNFDKVCVCKQCGKNYISSPYSPSARMYCSKECGEAANRINNNRDRYIIFERDDFRCFYCGRTSYEDLVKLHADHVYPKRLGGEDKAYNLVTACEECNLAKHDNPYEYHEELLRVILARNIRKNIHPETIIKFSDRHYKTIPDENT